MHVHIPKSVKQAEKMEQARSRIAQAAHTALHRKVWSPSLNLFICLSEARSKLTLPPAIFSTRLQIFKKCTMSFTFTTAISMPIVNETTGKIAKSFASHIENTGGMIGYHLVRAWLLLTARAYAWRFTCTPFLSMPRLQAMTCCQPRAIFPARLHFSCP